MRLIDADLLKSTIENFEHPSIPKSAERTILSIIANSETIDPVYASFACYCQECEYAINGEGGIYECTQWNSLTYTNKFCCYGKERRK